MGNSNILCRIPPHNHQAKGALNTAPLGNPQSIKELRGTSWLVTPTLLNELAFVPVNTLSGATSGWMLRSLFTTNTLVSLRHGPAKGLM